MRPPTHHHCCFPPMSINERQFPTRYGLKRASVCRTRRAHEPTLPTKLFRHACKLGASRAPSSLRSSRTTGSATPQRSRCRRCGGVCDCPRRIDGREAGDNIRRIVSHNAQPRFRKKGKKMTVVDKPRKKRVFIASSWAECRRGPEGDVARHSVRGSRGPWPTANPNDIPAVTISACGRPRAGESVHLRPSETHAGECPPRNRLTVVADSC